LSKMECLIGIQGPDFVLVASDSASGRSIIRMKDGKASPLSMKFTKRSPNVLFSCKEQY